MGNGFQWTKRMKKQDLHLHLMELKIRARIMTVSFLRHLHRLFLMTSINVPCYIKINPLLILTLVLLWLQPVDITLAVSERALAQKRLAENPFDINAMCMLNRAQEQVRLTFMLGMNCNIR